MREYRMATAYIALCGTFMLGQQIGIARGLMECYHCLWMDDFDDPVISLPQCLPKFNRDRIAKEKCPLGCMTTLMYGINNVSTEDPKGTGNTDRPTNSSLMVSTQGPLPRGVGSIPKGSSLYRGCSREEIHPSWESKCIDVPLHNEDVYKFKRVCYCNNNLCNDHFAIVPVLVRSDAERLKTWSGLVFLPTLVTILATIIFGESVHPLSEFHQ